MKTGKYFPELIVVCMAISFAASVTIVVGTEVPVTEWNEDARSQILNADELGNLAGVLPSWKMKQMTWPSAAEITSKGCKADEKVKLSCMGWVRKFMKKEHLSEDLNKHLIGMGNWGLVRKESEQKRLCDVFIVRFKRGPHVIHIQESPYNFVMTVADEQMAKAGKPDHERLVLETARSILNERLQPDPNSDFRLFRIGGEEFKISRVVWLTKCVGTTDKNGKKSADLRKAEKNGAINVQAETDGRFVKLEIIKYIGGPRMYLDPYADRF